jgi:hypothetical protein
VTTPNNPTISHDSRFAADQGLGLFVGLVEDILHVLLFA